MLYLIGLGLADETDITVKGLEIVKTADRVYLEAYTSILLVPKERLVGFPPLLPPSPSYATRISQRFSKHIPAC
jgi:Tetrapyrrole (Corrin/Porphyrin) Methylases